MDARTTRFTDRVASLFEHDGLPPIAGRIFALLLLSEDARSLDQLSAELGVSKASASTNTRLLAGFGLIEPVRQLGSRRDYYRTADDLFERSMAVRLDRWREFTDVIGEGRRTLPLATPSGPRATGALRGRPQLHGRRDRPRHGTLARRAVAAACTYGVRAVRRAALASALLLAGCAGTPSVSGVRGASPRPEVPWTPPADALPSIAPADTSARAAIPPDLADRIRRLTLGEIVDLGLRSNPTTRLAWANAHTAASVYGSERGAWYPSIDGDVSAVRIKTAASQGRSAVEQSVLTPSVTLNYLLLDFGGRSGRVSGARHQLLSASFRHNAAIQDVVLQVQIAYFQYLANRALLRAQRTTRGGGRHQPRRRRGAPPGRPRHHRGRAAGPHRREPGAAHAPDHRRQRADHPWRAGALPRPARQPAVRCGYDRRDRGCGVARGQRERDHRHRAPGPSRPGREPLRGRGGARRRDRGAGRAAAVARLQRHRRPDLRHHHPGRRRQLLPFARPLDPDLQRLLPAIRLARGGVRGRGRAGAHRDAPASRWSSRSSAPITRSRPPPGASAPPRICSPARPRRTRSRSARYKAGVGSVLDLLAAQSALASARAQRVEARLSWSVSLAQLAHDAGVLDPGVETPLRLTNDTTAVPPR